MPVRALGGCAAVVVTCALLATPVTAGVVPDLPDLPDVPDLPAPEVQGPDLPAPPALPDPGAVLPAVPGAPALPAGGDGSATPVLPGLAGTPGAPAPGAQAGAPPVALTGGATDVGSDRATVTGLLVPGSAPVTYAFEYGPDERYGRLTGTAALPAGALPVAVRTVLTGLAPDRPVHFRLVARSATGTTAGEDRVLVPAASDATLRRLARDVRGDRPGAALQLTPAATSGAPAGLALTTRSGRAPVTGLRADFGPSGGYLAELACRQDARGRGPSSGPLGPLGSGTFALAVPFRGAGRQAVRFDLLTGTCRGGTRVLRTLRSSITPTAVPARARAASAARPARAGGPTARAAQAGGCPDAHLRPSRRNGQRIVRAVRCLLSAERQAAGLSALRASGKLTRAARAHVGDMLRFRFLAHSRPGGPNLAARLKAVRYSQRAGETIGLGAGPQATPAATVRGWMGSTVHRDVIMQPVYRWVGIAVQPRAPIRVPARAATYTAVFGSGR